MNSYIAVGSLALLLIGTMPATAKKLKSQEWLTGKLIDTYQESSYRGSTGESSRKGRIEDTGDYSSRSRDSSRVIYAVRQVYVIETDTHVFEATHLMRWRWSKPALLTVNGPVEILILDRKIKIRDERGKTHKLSVLRRTLRTTQQ